ncbi:hypothetical protein [Krasilnikoviella flava]|nr:hypothetical protein [Krasilnikoviella flava]
MERQFDLLIAVSRHEVSIKDKDADRRYRERAHRIRAALRQRGVNDPFPWSDLSAWWDRCSELGTYRERRSLLRESYEPVQAELERMGDSHELLDVALTTEARWAPLESRIAGLVAEYGSARDLDQWQDVGRRSREILKDAVNLVYDESMCPDGTEVPKRGDAKARFDQIISARLAGPSFEQLRAWFNRSWSLANAATHSATAPRTAAFASGQSAVALARTLHLLARETAPASTFADEPSRLPEQPAMPDEPPF